jgi:UDP-N-acetylmuramoyl-L-alanyl-D-glutamate--2,6-diaminopimelate ligase
MFQTTFPVTCNTARIAPGSTFVAIQGHARNGELFIPEAIERGATTIVCVDNETTQAFKNQFPSVDFQFSPDPRESLATLASRSLGNPASKLKLIGVTGTSGKTTTTFLIEHILAASGFKTALVGSVKNKIGTSFEQKAALTTPPSDELAMFFAQCVKEGVSHVVMEVSSHALSLKRTWGLTFEVACFTNLSAEHLDFYHDMENYFQAKTELFGQLGPHGSAVVNAQDPWGQKLLTSLKNAPLRTHELNFNEHTKPAYTCPNLVGYFNEYNATMAGKACEALGLTPSQIKQALTTFPGVTGRMDMIRLENDVRVCIDHAHKPGAMECVLKALRAQTEQLIVVFGCGGNKDTSKRPVMGRLATQYGDIVIITNDNPRYEDPLLIAQAIEAGAGKHPHLLIELERRKAIDYALRIAKSGAIIALLGKGDEETMSIKGTLYPFSDYTVVRELAPHSKQ